MPRIGVVGTKAGWSSERLAATIAERTGERLLIEMQGVSLDLPGGSAWFQGIDLRDLDALIVKKIGARYAPDLLDRLEILRFLHERGLPIFSAPGRILRVLNRLSCTITLQAAGVPMPPLTITEDPAMAQRAVERYGAAVFKPLFTTKARGMRLIEAGPAAAAEIAEYHARHRLMYIQQKIELPGRDLGVVFLGGRYLTTYARRIPQNSWNSTTYFGGRYEAHDPSSETLALAERAQALFGLDFTCVDVAETDEGPVVFEVSAFGGFRGILEAREIDAAAALADHVLAELRR
ncbi:MAG: GAK system ATP-grasp enzyme [Candidatus Eisenbacteria bacterium]|nr:GAK system ATP-grasp enzyme [Candidatus Eisenbacteria bacterium]